MFKFATMCMRKYARAKYQFFFGKDDQDIEVTYMYCSYELFWIPRTFIALAPLTQQWFFMCLLLGLGESRQIENWKGPMTKP